LAVLGNTILTAITYFDGESDANHLVQIVDQERLVLEENAFTHGERLFYFTPKKFVQRMEAYWRTWKSERIS
jgi:hypothetical protein